MNDMQKPLSNSVFLSFSVLGLICIYLLYLQITKQQVDTWSSLATRTRQEQILNKLDDLAEYARVQSTVLRQVDMKLNKSERDHNQLNTSVQELEGLLKERH